MYAKGLLAVGSIAPDFNVRDAKGRELRRTTFRGKLLLIDFWGTWCPPCLAAVPHLKTLNNRYASKGLAVVSMAVADSKGDPVGFMRARGYRWTSVPKGDATARAFRVSMFPTLYLLGRDGKVLYRGAGTGEGARRALDSMLAKLLGGKFRP